jgi:arginase family enzyme
MDIAELSPILDINNNTSKLAARLAWEFLEHNQ